MVVQECMPVRKNIQFYWHPFTYVNIHYLPTKIIIDYYSQSEYLQSRFMQSFKHDRAFLNFHVEA